MTWNDKIFWYVLKIFNLVIVLVRSFLYCLLHPKSFFKLLFSFYSDLNEFYQVTHGKLCNFEKCSLYQEMKEKLIFAPSNIFNVDLRVARTGETQVLAAITNYLKPKTIFEIGTYNGFTTLHFAQNSPPESRIFTLDLPPDYISKIKNSKEDYSFDDLQVIDLSMENINKRFFKNHPSQSKIKELFGDSRSFNFSPYYGTIDLVFIDGNHSYEYVQSDTENAFRLLSPQGVIIWHDFDYIIHKEVFKFLNHLAQNHSIYSIPNTRFAIYGKKLSQVSEIQTKRG